MKKNILVIEDERNIRDTIEDILELMGYNVKTAANGQDGVNSVIESQPDLILCDVNMPILDGFGTLKKVRKIKDANGIPFVFLTARVSEKDFREGMNLGADDYLTKPFTKDELLHVVETRLAKRANDLLNYENKVQDLKEDLKEQEERMRKYDFANSHVLRAPVVSIIGLINLLLDSANVDDQGIILEMLKKASLELDQITRQLGAILTEEDNNGTTGSN